LYMYSIELRQLVTSAGLAQCTVRSKAAVIWSAIASPSTPSMNLRLVLCSSMEKLIPQRSTFGHRTQPPHVRRLDLRTPLPGTLTSPPHLDPIVRVVR
jgi:hypothetical protein